jgi:hypothetical protein
MDHWRWHLYCEQICFFRAVSVSFRSFYCLRGLRVIMPLYAYAIYATMPNISGRFCIT